MSQALKKLFFVFVALVSVVYLWNLVPKQSSYADNFGTINSSDGHFTLTAVDDASTTNSYYVGFNIVKHNGGSFQWQVIQHFCPNASDYCGNYGGDTVRSTGWQTASNSISNAGNSLGAYTPQIALPNSGYSNCGSYQIDVWIQGYSIPMNAGWYNTHVACTTPVPTATPTHVPPTATPTVVPPTATPTITQPVPTATPTGTSTNSNTCGDSSQNATNGSNNNNNCNQSSSSSSSSSSSDSSSNSSSSVNNSGNNSQSQSQENTFNPTINVNNNNTNNNTVNVPPAQIVYGSYAGNGTVQVQPASQATSLPKTGAEDLVYLLTMVPAGAFLKKFSKLG